MESAHSDEPSRRAWGVWLGKHLRFGVASSIGAVALLNVLTLTTAARLLNAQDLASFSIVILIATSAVSIQRAAAISPGFASQRGTGRAMIPLRWSLTISVPLACCLAVVSATFMPTTSVWLHDVSLYAATFFVCLAADIVRNRALGLGRAGVATVSDLVALTIFILAAFVIVRPDSAPALLSTFASCVALGLLIQLLANQLRSDGPLPAGVKFADAWRLGRWSGADELLSVTANVAPMILTVSVLNSTAAGDYRVLQSALGPLNLISTSIVVSAGIGAWRLSSPEAVARLGSWARRTTVRLAAATTLYVLVAMPAMVFISGLSSEDTLRVAIVCGSGALLGSFQVGPRAAALALGGQQYGFWIRVCVVAIAAVVTVLAIYTNVVPWHDPIGTIAILSSLANVIGWSLALRALRNRL